MTDKKINIENMLTFDEHIRKILKSDKEYRIMWLETIIEELKLLVEVMKDEI